MYRQGGHEVLTETVHIAVPTAFLYDESLYVEGTVNHIRNLSKQGVKSVLVSGTTGEQHSLSLIEKLELIDGIEKEAELIQNMEIIFGVSSVRQKDAEELAEKISTTNFSGIMIGYPPYIKPSQQEAIVYTERLLQLSNKPAILYNNPGRTGFDLAEESIIYLSQYAEIVGVKDAGSVEKVKRINKAIHRNDFYFYAGGEVELVEKVAGGYNRLSSIAGNVLPKEISQWFNKLVEQQEITGRESEQIHSILEEVYRGNAIVNVKKMISEQGIPIGGCRSPIGNS